MNPYLILSRTYQMLKLRQFTILSTILAHFDFDGSNTKFKGISKKLEQGQQKAGSDLRRSKTNRGAFDN